MGENINFLARDATYFFFSAPPRKHGTFQDSDLDNTHLPASKNKKAMEKMMLQQKRLETNSELVLAFLLVSTLRILCIAITRRDDHTHGSMPRKRQVYYTTSPRTSVITSALPRSARDHPVRKLRHRGTNSPGLVAVRGGGVATPPRTGRSILGVRDCGRRPPSATGGIPKLPENGDVGGVSGVTGRRDAYFRHVLPTEFSRRGVCDERL